MYTRTHPHKGGEAVAQAWLVVDIGHRTHGVAQYPPDTDLPVQCGCGELLDRMVETRALGPDDDPDTVLRELERTLLDRWHTAVRSQAEDALRSLAHGITAAGPGSSELGPTAFPAGWDYIPSFDSVSIEVEHPGADDPVLELDTEDLDLSEDHRRAVAEWARTHSR